MDARARRLLYRFVTRIVPLAAVRLRRLRRRAALIPDPALRRQALDSLAHKDFHVHGGCILATFLPPHLVPAYVDLVAAYETAVDYLDNLSDRMGLRDEADIRALHEALLDAVRPGAPQRNYFRHRCTGDGGYLRGLVTQTQDRFAVLAGYDEAADHILEATRRYCELQALKHLAPGERERRCARTFGAVAPDLQWWEGAAACGSTLPVFALAFAAAVGCSAERAAEIHAAYVPYIAALHILLDYFVDQSEDEAHNELNFVACYGSPQAALAGLLGVARRAAARAAAAPDAERHLFVVQAMCGFYATRPAIRQQGLQDHAREIAAAVGLRLDFSPRTGRGPLALATLAALYERAVRGMGLARML
jgi:tetraprenyl-beta-curcumene synthase